MNSARYIRDMGSLQVKDFPDDLNAQLVERAKAERVTLSEFVTRTLRKELSGSSLDTWIASIRQRDATPHDIDSAAIIDAVRGECSRAKSSTPRS